MVFFKLCHLQPSNVAVPVGAPRIVERQALAIQLLPVLQLEARTQTVRVCLEGRGGRASGHLQLLTAGALSLDDFHSLRVWKVCPRLHYTFNTSIPDELLEASQVALSCLIGTRAVHDLAGQQYFLLAHDDPGGLQLESLDLFAKFGFVYFLQDRTLHMQWETQDRGRTWSYR